MAKIYGYLTVPEGTAAMSVEHDTDAGLGYDVLVPTPGTYPVVRDDTTPGRVVCDIPATKVEHCRGRHLQMGLVLPGTYRWTAYAFQTRHRMVSDLGTFTPRDALPDVVA